ncbi:uncharacterized protein KRP23_11387 [Phytophthora ramorum]|uniref:uncharacterized protein n=1 Tax=Phytophthora ramorum TaxID=164328 RepID=UPI00309DC83D|nr:hypothetical protein KRP23_11387 [Phytophthora ramorum]
MSCEADDYAAQIREMLEVQRAAQQLLDQVAKNPPPEPGIPAPNAIGGRGGQSLQSHGDSEFFLDAFSAGRVSNESQGSSNIELDANAGKGKQQCSRDSEIVKIGSRQTGTTSWSSGEGKLKGSSGGRESQSVKLSISKKRPLLLTPTGVQKKQVPQRRSRSEFMNSARSASKQVAVKLAIQADANRFLTSMGDKGDMEECAFFDCNNQKKGAYEELTNGFLAADTFYNLYASIMCCVSGTFLSSNSSCCIPDESIEYLRHD